MRKNPEKKARRPPDPLLIGELLGRLLPGRETSRPQAQHSRNKRQRRRISEKQLRRLRNQVEIRELIDGYLKLPWKIQEGYFRFLCPLCREFNTATNPKTNLARCFRCGKNFNPIDMVMVVRGYGFLAAVDYLSAILKSPPGCSR